MAQQSGLERPPFASPPPRGTWLLMVRAADNWRPSQGPIATLCISGRRRALDLAHYGSPGPGGGDTNLGAEICTRRCWHQQNSTIHLS
jgi:hypothetical protein